MLPGVFYMVVLVYQIGEKCYKDWLSFSLRSNEIFGEFLPGIFGGSIGSFWWGFLPGGFWGFCRKVVLMVKS